MPLNLTSLGSLFGEPKLRLSIPTLERLQQPVGNDELDDLPRLDRSVSGAQIALLDQLIEAKGALKAEVGLLGTGAKVDPFGTGVEAPLTEAENPGLLSVQAGFDLKTEGGGDFGEARLSARAAASGAVLYRHWLPLDPERKLQNALASLVTGSRLPNLLDLERPPARGEVHSLEAKLRLDLGISAEAGFKVDENLLLDLSGDLSLPFRFNAEATLRAALGLSLYDRMALTVGRAHQVRDGWVRIRVQRAKERRLSFAATFTLDLLYDFGTGLSQLFEEMIDQVPVPRLVRTAETITETLSKGGWDSVKNRLTDEMEEVLDDIVSEVLELATGEDQDWRQWIETDPRVARIIDFASNVVEFYDSIDSRVASLWERLLGKADLGPDSQVHTWLSRLAGLDPQTVKSEDLLGGDAADLIDAIELITGRSIEEVVLDQHPALADTLTDVADVASRTLSLLTETPEQILEHIRAFAEKTGIRRTIDELRGLDSKEELETAVSTRVRNLAGRLVDKVWNRLTKSDLDAVRSWAEKVHEWLPDPSAPGTKAAELANRIKGQLEKVKLDYGLSIGVEIERVSRTSAILDLEIDDRQSAAGLRRKVAAALRTGRLQTVLEILADAADMVEAPGAPIDLGAPPPSHPFLLRECVFTSERIRAEAISISFDLVGLGKVFKIKERGINRRLEHSTVRVLSDGNAPPVRTGTYTAAFQRGDRTGPLETEAGVWLVSSLTSTDIRPGADYDTSVERYARLTFTWEGEHVDSDQIGGLAKLVNELGFEAAPPGTLPIRDLLQPGQHVRCAFEIRLDKKLLDRLFIDSWNGETSSERRWNRAFLNATYRWLREIYVHRGRITNSPWNLGHTLAHIVTDDLFRRNWLSVGGFFSELGGKTLHIPRPGEPDAQIEIGRFNDWKPVTGLLISILSKREAGWKAFRRLRKAYSHAITSGSPAAYHELSEAFADTWKRASLHTLQWPNSMNAIWIWIAALEALEPGLLQLARGVAVLRWREAASPTAGTNTADQDPMKWHDVIFWTLPQGIPKPQPGVFPIQGDL